MKDASDILRAAVDSFRRHERERKTDDPPINYARIFTPEGIAMEIPRLPNIAPPSVFRVPHTDVTIRVLDLGHQYAAPNMMNHIRLPRIGWLLELWAHATLPMRYSFIINVVANPIRLPWAEAGEWVRVWHDTAAIRAAMRREKMPRYALLQDNIVEASIKWESGNSSNQANTVEAYMICREVLAEDRIR